MNSNKLFTFVRLLISLSIIFAGSSVFAETTLEKIKRTGKVTVGTEAAFPPFEFVEDGKIVGYGKDILDYIVADMKVELNQLDLPWQGILPGVYYENLEKLVSAIYFLNLDSISSHTVMKSEELLSNFHQEFIALYG